MYINSRVDFPVDVGRRKTRVLNVELNSYDENSHIFEISFLDIELDDTYEVNVLSHFEESDRTAYFGTEIRDGVAVFMFDTDLISMDEKVTNYVYLKKGDYQIEVNSFRVNVNLSKIDEKAVTVAKAYDNKYDTLLKDFELAIKKYRDSLPSSEEILEDVGETIRELEELNNSFGFQEEERVNKESERVSSESIRDESERERVAHEETRIQNEQKREEDELNRKSSEDNRLVSEQERKSSEEERVISEQMRTSAEEEREVSELTRRDSEQERVENESIRAQSEQSREEGEAERVISEDARESSELERMVAEDERARGETIREVGERERVLNESIRKTAEEERVEREDARADLYELVKQRLADGEFIGEKGDTGDGLEYKWEGTSLGVRKEGDTEYVYVDLKGEKGDTGEMENLDSTHIVDALGYVPISATDVPDPTWENLQNKPTEFNPTSHSHSWAQVTGRPTTFAPSTHSHSWSEVTNKPSTFAPSTHTHGIDDVTGLRAELDSVPELTKENVGLGNVDNVKQASKADFDGHNSDATRHITSVERTKWNTVDDKVDKVTGKGLSANDYTTTEKNKLAGIEAGAQVNSVTSVAGKTGAVVVSKSDVGLSNVDNVKQASKVEHDQLSSDFTAHQAEKVHQGEVHGMRITDDKFEFFNGAEWVELKGGGGSSVRLGNVLDLTIEPLLGNKIKITWADPEDVILEGITLAQWKGTQLRRKLNTYPIDEKDGELITNNIVRNQYIDGYLDEDLSSGQRYYYALFPYTLDNVYTLDVVNRVDVIAFEKYEQSPPIKPAVGNLGALKATVSSDVGSVVSLNQADWFASPHEFADLVENEVYTPYAKFEETSDKWESSIARGDTFVAINKLPQNPPPAPSISNLDFNKVTVTGISGTEVRLGSGEWLDSPQTFTGLTEETTYQVYARMKETEDNFASDSSVAKAFTTPTELQLYGFEIDETNSNPKTAVTYIEDAIGMTPASGNDGNFNWGSWEPFIKEISKPVVMKAGVEQYDLNYDDYTKKATGGNSILTGADGDVFTKLQHLHMKHEKITNGHRWLLASKPFDGSFSMTEELENGYNQFNNPILVTLQNLYLLIFKDRDSQTALGRGRVDGAGYIASGNTNDKGYMFGSTQDLQMKFLGIEDFWGNKFQWVDGLMTDSNWDILHGTGNFNDTGSGYTKQTTAVSANINGYPMKVQGGKGGYVPADSSASETTGYADYGALNASRLAYFGGAQGGGGVAGAFYVRVNYSASYSNASLSARLCYKNAEAVYIGAYLGFEQSGKLRSISGNMPTDTRTIGQFRTLAKENN